MNFARRVTDGLKAFAMSFGTGTRYWWHSTISRTRFDYEREVGSGRGNSIVEACVGWITRTFPEAPIRVLSVNADGEDTEQADHPLKLLLDSPNPYYPGELLWSATLADRTTDGNAYWIKIRAGSGRPAELWWVPHYMMQPRWPEDGSEFISHYEYSPAGVPQRIETKDVVHFRYGLDPRNPRKGLSPLRALFREIFTDDEAANYTASMLRNVGVPPVVISPGKDAKPTTEELEEVKQKYVERTTGDNRGMPLVMRGETHVAVLGFSPLQMDTRTARRVPEERVSAVLGIPAAVVGLGTGLENTKVGATMTQMREQAYESNIIPTQRLIAAELRSQLLIDFGDVRRLKIDFDLSQVRVLQQDQNDLHARARDDLKSGGITLNEFREMIELEPLTGPEGDLLFVPINVTPTAAAELLVAPGPSPVPLVSLPPAKVLALPARSRKASPSVGLAIQRLRGRLQSTAEKNMGRFFTGQLERVVARLEGRSKAVSDLPGADQLMPADEDQLLRAALQDVYLSALQGMHGLTEDALGITFELDDPLTSAYLADAGSQIVGINNTTRAAIRDALVAGLLLGEGISQIASRLRGLTDFNQARATLVARTELGQASNLAAVHSYRASGVVLGVLILDGDYDAACAARNGTRVPISMASSHPPLLHPNCTAAFLPITDSAELEVAA